MPIAVAGALLSGVVLLGLLLAVRHGRAHGGVVESRAPAEEVTRMEAQAERAAPADSAAATDGVPARGPERRGNLGDRLAAYSSRAPRRLDERSAHQRTRAVLRGAFGRSLQVCGRRPPRRPMAWVIRDLIQIVDGLRADLESLYFASGGGAEASETRVQTRLLAKGVVRRILEWMQ